MILEEGEESLLSSSDAGETHERTDGTPRSSLVAIFSLTIFTSATLLFLVQPIIAKRILPLLGGAPNVWNTCMVFFQAVLLAGYAFAHVTARRMSSARQGMLQVAMLVIAAVALPIALHDVVLRM